MSLTKYHPDLICSPVTHAPLELRNGRLESADRKHSYALNYDGIPLFAEFACSEEARRQQSHYDRIAENYIANLSYPHTQEYMRFLDTTLLQLVSPLDFSTFAEICCGTGEACSLLDKRIGAAVGVDISVAMLSVARKKHPSERYIFAQGDATQLPLASEAFTSVAMLGGIHHVNDRYGLFREIYRVLKPGGWFVFREPVSDFFLWRWLRSVVYRVSPILDADTERPLTYGETVPPLIGAGFQLRHWETLGFWGYCLLMNSDVLVFNRLFRALPGIRGITRAMCMLDKGTVSLPGMARKGLIVIGLAQKPA